MKKKIFKWLNKKNFAYKLAVKLIANRIILGKNLLTPQYLLDRGWIEKDEFYFEPCVKDRDVIFIKFYKDVTYYNVYHSSDKIFITCQDKIEWFEMYYALITDEDLYTLAGI